MNETFKWIAGIVLLIFVIFMQRFQDSQREAKLELVLSAISYNPSDCGEDLSLEISLENIGEFNVVASTYRVSAKIPGFSAEKVDTDYSFSTDKILLPHEPWTTCIELPTLERDVRENPAGLVWSIRPDYISLEGS